MKSLLSAAGLLLTLCFGLSVVSAFQNDEKQAGSSNAAQQAAQGLSSESLKEITLYYRGKGWGKNIPNYEVVLRQNGTATYAGEGLMQLKGKYKGEIERDDFRQLAEFFLEEGFFELPDYDEKAPQISHSEMIILSVLRREERKTVAAINKEGPPKLAAFELMLKRALTKIVWEIDNGR
jgi:hypothetical protein